MTLCRQISRLEKDREDMVAQYEGSDAQRDGKRVETLMREKAKLHLRLKGLEAEVAELRAQKDNSGQQAENVQRIQIRQLTESQAAVKSLEVRPWLSSCHTKIRQTKLNFWLPDLFLFCYYILRSLTTGGSATTGGVPVVAFAAGADGERASSEQRAEQSANQATAQS